jgi:hypothetical protein
MISDRSSTMNGRIRSTSSSITRASASGSAASIRVAPLEYPYGRYSQRTSAAPSVDCHRNVERSISPGTPRHTNAHPIPASRRILGICPM